MSGYVCIAMLEDPPYSIYLAATEEEPEDWCAGLPLPTHLLWFRSALEPASVLETCIHGLRNKGIMASQGRPFQAKPNDVINVLIKKGFKLEYNPHVNLETNLGNVVIELYPDKAPLSVYNFLTYIAEAHYDNTIIHRVIPGCVIQCGGFQADWVHRPQRTPIANEANNGLLNQRGTVSMARPEDPHSATDSFYINLSENSFLNHKNQTKAGWGYSVFGKVVKGMNIVDDISNIPTGPSGPMPSDVPQELVIIKNASII